MSIPLSTPPGTLIVCRWPDGAVKPGCGLPPLVKGRLYRLHTIFPRIETDLHRIEGGAIWLEEYIETHKTEGGYFYNWRFELPVLPRSVRSALRKQPLIPEWERELERLEQLL